MSLSSIQSARVAPRRPRPSRAHEGRAHEGRAHEGRALVECCVAMLLLAGTATVVLLLGNTSAQLVNGALAQDVAQRTMLSHSSALQLHACQTAASVSSEAVRNRYVVNGAERPDGLARHEALHLRWRLSALGTAQTGRAWHELFSQGAALCE